MTGKRQSHELVRKLGLGQTQSPPQPVCVEGAGRERVEDWVSRRGDRGRTSEAERL